MTVAMAQLALTLELSLTPLRDTAKCQWMFKEKRSADCPCPKKVCSGRLPIGKPSCGPSQNFAGNGQELGE